VKDWSNSLIDRQWLVGGFSNLIDKKQNPLII